LGIKFRLVGMKEGGQRRGEEGLALRLPWSKVSEEEVLRE